MKQKNLKIVDPKLLMGFFLVELFVLVSLKLVQTIYPHSVADTFLMFGAILINALFMLYLVIHIKKLGIKTLITGIPLAIFTTLLADCFLVLLKDLADDGWVKFMSGLTANMIGFFVFGMVQIVYAFYLNPTKLRWIIRGAFYLLFVVIVYAAGMFTLDKFIACLSMSQLILNLVFSWKDHIKAPSRTSLILAIGLTLFFLCDAFIALRMTLPEDNLMYEIICFMVWVFYIPSQVVLTTAYVSERAENKRNF